MVHMSYFFIEELKVYYVLKLNRETLQLDFTMSGLNIILTLGIPLIHGTANAKQVQEW